MALIVNDNEITRNQHFLINEAKNETNFDKFSFQSAKYYYVLPSRDELMKLQKILRNSTVFVDIRNAFLENKCAHRIHWAQTQYL